MNYILALTVELIFLPQPEAALVRASIRSATFKAFVLFAEKKYCTSFIMMSYGRDRAERNFNIVFLTYTVY